MRSTMRSSVLSVVLCASVAGIGCSGDDGGDDGGTGGTGTQQQETQIELFSWWIQPGEAEALQALMDLHRSNYPNERIYNAAADSGPQAKEILSQRLANGEPPDLFQQNAYEMKTFLADHPGEIEPLDDLFEAQGLNDVMAPELLNDVTFDGHIYSLPVNIHRENALFYNKQIFKDNGLEPPTTQAQFLSVCADLKAAGVTPVALSTTQGWIVTKLFNELALGSMGAQVFADYFSGAEPLDEAKLGAAIDVLDQVLTEYIDVDFAAGEEVGWTQATEAVFNGDAAMFLHGDWVKAYLVQLGWTPNVDFGVVGAPGASDAFLYGLDVFGIPAGAQHADAARDFLTTVSSTEGQTVFNSLKGSSPMRLDLDGSEFDAMSKEVIADFKDASIRLAVRGKSEWDDAMLEFAKTHDKAALIQAFKDNPPGT